MDESGISAQIKAQATVVCCDPEQDIALLKLKDNIFTNSTVFYLDNIIPPVGETIHNVGNYKGDFAEYSFSSGVIAYLNRHMISWDYLDQSTFTIYTGSSGSGVFLDDGRCIGIVVMCANGGDSCGFYIPIRRILHWARERKFEYLLNPALPVGQ
jgi:S1-C subfamily serine protease